MMDPIFVLIGSVLVLVILACVGIDRVPGLRSSSGAIRERIRGVGVLLFAAGFAATMILAIAWNPGGPPPPSWIGPVGAVAAIALLGGGGVAFSREERGLKIVGTDETAWIARIRERIDRSGGVDPPEPDDQGEGEAPDRDGGEE